jgi:hypothetical protein
MEVSSQHTKGSDRYEGAAEAIKDMLEEYDNGVKWADEEIPPGLDEILAKGESLDGVGFCPDNVSENTLFYWGAQNRTKEIIKQYKERAAAAAQARAQEAAAAARTAAAAAAAAKKAPQAPQAPKPAQAEVAAAAMPAPTDGLIPKNFAKESPAFKDGYIYTLKIIEDMIKNKRPIDPDKLLNLVYAARKKDKNWRSGCHAAMKAWKRKEAEAAHGQAAAARENLNGAVGANALTHKM